MARSGRLVTRTIVLLSATESVYWLVGATLLYMLRGLFAGVDSPQGVAQARIALLLGAWCAVNVAGLVVYWLRRSPGLLAMAGVQAANLIFGLWVALTSVAANGTDHGALWSLLQPAAASLTLVLLYVTWSRIGHQAAGRM